MRYLRRGIRLERLMLAFLGLLLVGVGAGAAWYCWQKGNILVVLSLVAAGGGLLLLGQQLRQPKAVRHPLFELLQNNPEHIVWVYVLNTQSMPFGFHLWDNGTIYFMLADGEEITVSLPAQKLKMVSRFLNRVLPHAAFGYSEERRRQFATDPELLRKKI